MLSARLLSEKFWLRLAALLLVIEWSIPVVAQALYAESHVIFSLAFALGWAGLLAGLGLLFYRLARSRAPLARVAMVLALATLALLYRAPACFIEPQFRAEDAVIFFAQQRELGWGAFLVPYNGYYHTVVRLGAALTAHLPTLFLPAFYNLAWLGIYSLVVAYILFQYPDRKLAPVVALVTALISHTCEVYLSLTDAIWIGGLALTTFVLFPVPEVKRWICYVLAGVLLIFSLSGPFSVILSPFYFLRWIANRKTFPVVYLVAVALGAAAQLSALHPYYAKPSGAALAGPSLLLCLKVVVLRLPWSLAVGYQPVEAYWLIGLALFLVLLGFMGWEIKTEWRKHVFPLSCLVLCATYVLMDFIRISPLEALVPLVNGDRYFYIPKILFVWALIHLAALARNPKPFQLALVLCVMGSMVEFTSAQITVDNHWPRYAVLIDQGQPVTVPVNPPGWAVTINGHPLGPNPK